MTRARRFNINFRIDDDTREGTLGLIHAAKNIMADFDEPFFTNDFVKDVRDRFCTKYGADTVDIFNAVLKAGLFNKGRFFLPATADVFHALEH